MRRKSLSLNQYRHLMLKEGEHPIIFTDLDGTLLDHDSYGTDVVEPLLKQLKHLNIDVIPTTSKTQAEVLALREKLDLTAPFIVENGAAILIPTSTFQIQPEHTFQTGSYWIKSFSVPRLHWISMIGELSNSFNGSFKTFSVMTNEELAIQTGLTLKEAERAKQRQYGEPVQWLGSEIQKKQFIKILEEQGARVLEGGRFLHVSGKHDKGQAMNWLINQYQQLSMLKPTLSITLGDSQNDIAMLEQSDIAIRIASHHHNLPTLIRTNSIIDCKEYGPKGWDQSIRLLLANILKSEVFESQ